MTALIQDIQKLTKEYPDIDFRNVTKNLESSGARVGRVGLYSRDRGKHIEFHYDLESVLGLIKFTPTKREEKMKMTKCKVFRIKAEIKVTDRSGTFPKERLIIAGDAGEAASLFDVLARNEDSYFLRANILSMENLGTAYKEE